MDERLAVPCGSSGGSLLAAQLRACAAAGDFGDESVDGVLDCFSRVEHINQHFCCNEAAEEEEAALAKEAALKALATAGEGEKDAAHTAAVEALRKKHACTTPAGEAKGKSGSNPAAGATTLVPRDPAAQNRSIHNDMHVYLHSMQEKLYRHLAAIAAASAGKSVARSAAAANREGMYDEHARKRAVERTSMRAYGKAQAARTHQVTARVA
jgi:hypothetical protein